MPRSKPSRITYIATARPMIAAQMTSRYDSMARPHTTCSLGTVRSVDENFVSAWRGRWRRRCAAAAGLKRGVLWSARDQSVDVVETDREYDAVDQHEQYESR